MRSITFVLCVCWGFIAAPAPLTREGVVAETMKPYAGESAKGVDVSTMHHKVMCGYQGWFNCEGDGADRGWVHWTQRGGKPPGPNNVKVDLWPDVSELSPGELFDTDFKLKDGTAAKLFSSYK